MVVQVKIGFSTDWKEYSRAWMAAMWNHYWYKESPIFDFNKDEELDEMQTDFDKPGNLFLEARRFDNNEIVGVLGLRHHGVMARLRRWEPATIPDFQNSSIVRILLERSCEHLSAIGVKRVGYLLKHPFDSPELVREQISHFQELGFEQSRPDSVDLTMPLDSFQHSTPSSGAEFETGENYTFEDLASITVKSFTSTAEERDIHGFDKTVTEHIQATALLQRMAEGFYGHSPDQFRKIAVIDGVAAGFVGAFVNESKYKPLTGVIGPMAVLPEFRRCGIAQDLISEILISLKEYGCGYAAVGTPASNIGALKLYEKAGFKLACRLVNLEKQL
ncbi:MAG: GNAT family N-acetyltransferase [Candidatus Thorarchaeota archaeon]|jgi:ribosomal protein S18 acetylase RimI-like enzyme